MSKAKSNVVKNTKRVRRDAITAEKFLSVYVPMAQAGKSAAEIGAALGRDAQFVTVKASNLRKRLKEEHADVELLKLRGVARNKGTAEIASFLKNLLATADETESEVPPAA